MAGKPQLSFERAEQAMERIKAAAAGSGQQALARLATVAGPLLAGVDLIVDKIALVTGPEFWSWMVTAASVFWAGRMHARVGKAQHARAQSQVRLEQLQRDLATKADVANLGAQIGREAGRNRDPHVHVHVHHEAGGREEGLTR